ncbi:hypothetical protein CLV28_2133 [Sediminihabitans luteus]|uniref:Uncharacterized protein n=1 Tax=Sediminihabitans luteus TaxID=1138585 RepID=A0A2M9CEL1_9CELL|nr:hypothetical protein [Sediminihabitans luteus]PJJ70302.1 hypothetical protein CLV28_2133 [Sediminihabitans luteus]GII97773.1 hypothetical protein Slu03_01510 [Sediminihabitans luteus]
MLTSTRAVGTAVAAVALAAAAFAGAIPLLVASAVLVALLAYGWPALLDLPAPGGTRTVMLLAGFGAVAGVHLTKGEQALRNLPLVLAMAVLLAFVNEMIRHDGRPRLVDSVTGTVTGTVIAVATSGWLATVRSDGGVALVVACAAALAVAAAFSALSFRGWWGEGLTVLVGVVGGGAVAAVMPDLPAVDGVWAGLVAGLLVAAAHLLLGRMRVVRESRAAALAAIVLPVALGGSLVYVVGRIVGV